MKKRVLGLIVAAGMIFSLAGCGNQQVFDTTYKFDKAYIYLPNGDLLVEGKIDSWRDFEDSDQIQIVINGVTYLTTMNNVVMIHGGK